MPLLGLASPTPTEIEQRLGEVFQRREFQPSDPSLQARLLQAIVDFFRWLSKLYDQSPPLFWLLLIVCIVLLIAIIAHIAYTIRRVFQVVRTRGSEDEDRERERRLRSEIHRQEARRAAEASDYTEAIRHLFLSLVYRLDEAGRIEFQKAYTNREYLELFHDQPQRQQTLAVFVDLLDVHWYGVSQAPQADYERCLELHDHFA